MNAYELADELEELNWLEGNSVFFPYKAQADMLRQQADRIAKLEKAIFKESKYLQNVKKAVLANEQG